MLQRIIGALFSTSRVLKGAGFVPKYAAVLARRVASQVAAPLLVAHGFSGSRSARACPQTTPGTPEKSAIEVWDTVSNTVCSLYVQLSRTSVMRGLARADEFFK